MPIIVVVSFLTGISPVQTPFENPGMNNFTTNLGPSQQPPGIKIYVRYLLYDVCLRRENDERGDITLRYFRFEMRQGRNKWP